MVTVPFLRSRLPESRVAHASTQPRATTSNRASYLKDRTFWIINLANTVQSLAYFVPMLWLPSWSSLRSSLDVIAHVSPISLCVFNSPQFSRRLPIFGYAQCLGAYWASRPRRVVRHHGPMVPRLLNIVTLRILCVCALGHIILYLGGFALLCGHVRLSGRRMDKSLVAFHPAYRQWVFYHHELTMTGADYLYRR